MQVANLRQILKSCLKIVMLQKLGTVKPGPRLCSCNPLRRPLVKWALRSSNLSDSPPFINYAVIFEVFSEGKTRTSA